MNNAKTKKAMFALAKHLGWKISGSHNNYYIEAPAEFAKIYEGLVFHPIKMFCTMIRANPELTATEIASVSGYDFGVRHLNMPKKTDATDEATLSRLFRDINKGDASE